jgi:hypothetical protein
MNEDVADGVLLDVRAVGMADLLLLDEGSSALDKALERLLTSSADGCYNSFNSNI